MCCDSLNNNNNNEKLDKNIDLYLELKTSVDTKEIIIMPIVIGATGVISKSFRHDLETIPCKISRPQLQKTALLGTMRIVRRITQIEE